MLNMPGKYFCGTKFLQHDAIISPVRPGPRRMVIGVKDIGDYCLVANAEINSVWKRRPDIKNTNWEIPFAKDEYPHQINLNVRSRPGAGSP